MTGALQEVRGVLYPADLPPLAIEALEAAQASDTRVRIRYGRDYHSNAGVPFVVAEPEGNRAALRWNRRLPYGSVIGWGISHIETTRSPVRVIWERPAS